MLDLVLAILHHLLILSLAGLLAVERVLVEARLERARPWPPWAESTPAYGATAGLVLVVGFCRVYLGG